MSGFETDVNVGTAFVDSVTGEWFATQDSQEPLRCRKCGETIKAGDYRQVGSGQFMVSVEDGEVAADHVECPANPTGATDEVADLPRLRFGADYRLGDTFTPDDAPTVED